MCGCLGFVFSVVFGLYLWGTDVGHAYYHHTHLLSYSIIFKEELLISPKRKKSVYVFIYILSSK